MKKLLKTLYRKSRTLLGLILRADFTNIRRSFYYLFHDRKNPRISVIIPFHNVKDYLGAAIDSVLASEGVDVEIILVDDASTDGTLEIAREYERKYFNVRVIQLTHNMGVYVARNFGLAYATQTYVGFLDADDVTTPERFITQIKTINAKRGLVASMCLAQRFDETLTTPLANPRHASITLVILREALKQVGYFDQVRFGADDEFMYRMQAIHGKRSIERLSTVMYKARFREGSLTTQKGASALYTYSAEGSERVRSEARKDYYDNYAIWHKTAKKEDLFMPFPLRRRKFAAGAPEQEAPFFGNDTITVGLTSFPPREEQLKIAIKSLVDQADCIKLYLNEYTEIPAWLSEFPTVHTTLAVHGDLKEVGKFAQLDDVEGYVSTVDDDIIYPTDYIARSILRLEQYQRKVIIGVHAVRFNPLNPHYLSDRTVFHFKEPLGSPTPAETMGSGTCTYHTSVIKFTRADFPILGHADLFIGKKSVNEGVPLICVDRPENWLVEIDTPKESRLYQTNKANVDANEAMFAEQLLPELKRKWASERPLPSGPMNLHIVVNGWNCAAYVNECLDSIHAAMKKAEAADITFSGTIVDDASTDPTNELIRAHALGQQFQVVRHESNVGAARARHYAIREIENPEAIVVLVDLDDMLREDALVLIADAYRKNRRLNMTLGNWQDQNGRVNPEGRYSKMVLNNALERIIRPFMGTHCRTFKRWLYDVIDEYDLQDVDGSFVRYCTDLAIIIPMMDQLIEAEVHYFKEPIYIYRIDRHNNSSAHAKGDKVRVFNVLAGKPMKPRFTALPTLDGKTYMNLISEKK
ncbi:MAG: heparosan synthase [Actinomycetota bacterium]